MVTSATRRQVALDAIAAVLGGVVAHAAETELVDFKLEDGRWDHRAAAPREIGHRATPPRSRWLAKPRAWRTTQPGAACSSWGSTTGWPVLVP